TFRRKKDAEELSCGFEVHVLYQLNLEMTLNVFHKGGDHFLNLKYLIMMKMCEQSTLKRCYTYYPHK
ncbi:hypothetical protein, partial [Bacteroides fragilis]